MESISSSLFVITFVLVIVVVIIKLLNLGKSVDTTQSRQDIRPKYRYARRNSIMTQAEIGLFRRLEVICADRYYIFPQVHLSSLLDHAAFRQDWRAALAVIQRKSVDFVLVDKETLETKYAIELDDSTHDRLERQKRDEKVEYYLAQVNIPLIRLRNIQSMTDEQIENEFRLAHESHKNAE